MTAIPANPTSPMAVCLWDPVGGTSSSGIPAGVTSTPMPVVPSAGYSKISTNGTTTVNANPGIYCGLYIQTAGAASNTLIVYDGTTVIAGTFTNIATGSYAASPMGIGLRTTTSLIVVSATGTAAGGNVLWD